MAQPETGGVKTSDGESAKFETLSDDEEITIPSQDIEGSLMYGILISVMNN